MDEALVEDAEDEVDDHDGQEKQERHAGQGLLEGRGLALEDVADVGGQFLFRQGLDGGHGLAQGVLAGGIERDGHRGELPGVVDHERPHALGHFDQAV